MQKVKQTVIAVAARTGRRNRFLLIGVATLAAAVAVVSAGRQAHAYENLTELWALVDTGNCQRLEGNLSVQAFPNGCELEDSWDGTFFKSDPGGVAIKLELHDGSGLVAKVEWHPYGEYLWVYDTRSDGDTVYVDFYCTTGAQTRLQATSTPTIMNFDIPEGDLCTFDVYDDIYFTDLITVTSWGTS